MSSFKEKLAASKAQFGVKKTPVDAPKMRSTGVIIPSTIRQSETSQNDAKTRSCAKCGAKGHNARTCSSEYDFRIKPKEKPKEEEEIVLDDEPFSWDSSLYNQVEINQSNLLKIGVVIEHSTNGTAYKLLKTKADNDIYSDNVLLERVDSGRKPRTTKIDGFPEHGMLMDRDYYLKEWSSKKGTKLWKLK